MINASKKKDPRSLKKWINSGALRPIPPPPPAPLTNEQKQRIISEYIKSPQGRSLLAASMMAPLRAQIDYASIGRKVFPVQQLPPGATVLYEREPETQDQQVASTLKGIVEMLEDLSGWSYRNYGNTAEELL